MTTTVERVVLATDGSTSATTTAAHALFLTRVLDASLQAVSATGMPQPSAAETTEAEITGASVSATFETEEAVGVVTRQVLLTGVCLISEIIGGPAATAVVLGVSGDSKARFAGYRAVGTVASHVVHHAKVPTLVVPSSTGGSDTSGPRGRR